MEQEIRPKLLRIIASAILLAVCVVIEKNVAWATWQLLLIFLVPYLVAGYDVLIEAAEDLLQGKALGEDFLMSIATMGALVIGFLPGAEAQFPESVFVMLFFQVGELFEDLAEGKSRQSISQLMDIRPDSAHVVRNGNTQTVKPEEVAVGETIMVMPGEKVPMDGIVTKGDSSLDTVALTGESVPRGIHAGDEIMSGCVNLSGMVTVRVSKPFGESTAAKVLDLVENAAENKSHSEYFITKFARIYTPIVVALAVATALLPPLFSGDFSQTFPTWLYRGLMFLVVSCPCALVISVPLAFFSGIGGASRQGILVKGSNYMETLAKVKNIAFDKTGTLTQGVFQVTAVHPDILDEHQLLHLAAHVESFSKHPIALSLVSAYHDRCQDEEGDLSCCPVDSVEEIAGQGVSALVSGRRVSVGNSKLMDAIGAQWRLCDKTGTIVHVAVDGIYAGHVVVSDRLKADAAESIAALQREGIRRIVMLSGDKEGVVEDIAHATGITEYRAELLPADKLHFIEQQSEPFAFVGDGINDAPVLARADIGIAMGALGSDAAIEAADIVLMDDKPSKIALAIRQARRTLRIAHQNTWFAIGIKVLVLVLAFLGIATMWMAVFADVGVTVLAVLNSMRTLRRRNLGKERI